MGPRTSRCRATPEPTEVVTTVTEPTRRHLSQRQAEIVDRLIEAAACEARERGYEKTTVRGSARRAGVAPATAYTYFASKDHLLAEVLWRQLDGLDPVEDDPSAGALERVTRELAGLATFMASDPDLATACTAALLGTGADVKLLRDRFGGRIIARISEALGDDADPRVLRTLNLALVGAMLSAGMGNLDFTDVQDAMASAAALLIKGAR
jgi:AcrR family transcriptional regulator